MCTSVLCKINLFKFILNLLNVKLQMSQISGEVHVELSLIQFISNVRSITFNSPERMNTLAWPDDPGIVRRNLTEILIRYRCYWYNIAIIISMGRSFKGWDIIITWSLLGITQVKQKKITIFLNLNNQSTYVHELAIENANTNI